MKRDLDLVRNILLHVEKNADRAYSNLEDIEIDGWNDEEISYHVSLMKDGGLLNATIDKLPDQDDGDLTFIEYSVHGITMTGHEFLEEVRNPETWSKTKAALKKTGEWSLKATVDIATAIIKAKIDLFLQSGKLGG